MKKPRNSFSTLDGLAFCGRRLWYDRTGERRETLAMARGTQVHGAFEKLTEAAMATSWRQAYLHDDLAEYVPDGPWPRGKVKEWLYAARPLLEKTRPTVVERWFDEVVGKTKICGRIDFESDRLPLDAEDYEIVGLPRHGLDLDRPCVLDFKTVGSAAYTKTPDEARRSPQLGLYCAVTGYDYAGFVYLLPNMASCATIVEVHPNAKKLVVAWIDQMADLLSISWERAVRIANEYLATTDDVGSLDTTSLRAKAIDVGASAFEPARFLDPWCNPKCDHWKKCFGDLEKGRM